MPSRRTLLRLSAWVLATGLLALRALAGPYDDLPPAPTPDLDYYASRLARWVDANCARCHRDGAGDLLLPGPDASASTPAARWRGDFERLSDFLDPDRPRDSAVIRKLIDLADGGDPHGGGVFTAPEEQVHDLLLDLASGATLDNYPPEVWFKETEIRTRPGETVVIDGRYSFDRNRGDKLLYRWEIYAVPPGAHPLLSDIRAGRLEFTPDVGGTYVLRLRVGDGKVWSVPDAVSVEVFESVVPEKRDPAGLSGLEKANAKRLRRVRRLYLDVLGRSPTPGEALAADTVAWDRLVAGLLQRPEAARARCESLALDFGLVGEMRPTSDEAAAVALRMAAEGMTPPDAEAVFVRDPSFLEAHPPGRALAEAIANLLLGRPPTSDEVAAALRLAAGQDADVPGVGPVSTGGDWVASVLRSDAFRRAAVHRRLSRFLGSGDADRRLPAAAAAAREGGAAWRAYLQERLVDRSYTERVYLHAKDDLTFLRGLFVDLLGRKPTEREWYSLWQVLHVVPGQSAARAAVVKILLDSGQTPLPLLVDIPHAPHWIRDRFLRYLGRVPSVDEMKTFGQVLLHPAGGPNLVVRALLTGPEYQCR